MITTLRFNEYRHARGRFWDGEMPEARGGSTVVECPRLLASRRAANRRSIGLEVVIPKGGRALYGLLGATLAPSSDDALRVRVTVAESRGDMYSSPIAPESECVWCGVPNDLGAAVLDGVVGEALDDPNRVPSGDLSFGRGAYGEIGSNRALYLLLGKAIAQILFREIMSAERVAEIIEGLRP